MEAAVVSSPAVSPAAAAALLEEGDAAHARCKKLLPAPWVSELKADSMLCRMVRPVIERHVQCSPNAWQAAMQRGAMGKMERQVERVNAKAEKGVPRCDGCGMAVPGLKWCACRLKRYCGKECQRRDFPAHKAECKKARGIA